MHMRHRRSVAHALRAAVTVELRGRVEADVMAHVVTAGTGHARAAAPRQAARVAVVPAREGGGGVKVRERALQIIHRKKSRTTSDTPQGHTGSVGRCDSRTRRPRHIRKARAAPESHRTNILKQ